VGNPEETLSEREKKYEVRSAIKRLDPNYRVLIILKYYEAKSYKEISEITGISEKKVKSRLYTARMILKDLIKKDSV
jgi:RNA polymerase sigma-70 factor (ECF subfamily)